jgi:pullulanase/glycogen debranching enzyme
MVFLTQIQAWMIVINVDIFREKMVFAKLKNFFAKLTFFPPKFFFLRKISLFQNTKKKFWRGKNQLSKKVFFT